MYGTPGPAADGGPHVSRHQKDRPGTSAPSRLSAIEGLAARLTGRAPAIILPRPGLC